MVETTTSRNRHSSNGRALGFATASVVLLFVAVSALNPHPIADEGGQHLRAIRQFYNGDWTPPAHLPMLPAYHAFACLCWKIFGPHLVVLRALSALMGLLAIIAFAAVTRNRGLDQSDDVILHFAWLPILFPFLAIVYTEAMSMLCMVVAVLLHVRRRFPSSAGMLLLACLVRQSNVVWVAFMGVWALMALGDDRHAGAAHGPARPVSRTARVGLARVWAHAVVLALAAGFFIYNRGVTLTEVEANRARINVAQFYLFALFVIALWAPIWISRFRYDARTLGRWALRHPAAAGLVVVLALSAVVALTQAYANPHPWNENVNYLRNLPLIAMSESWSARAAAACLIVMAGPIVVRFTLNQADRRLLAAVWLFSFLFLLPHSLAEPRYYIIPALFVNLFTRYTAGQARCLTIWYLAISAAIGAYVCLKGGPGGGTW